MKNQLKKLAKKIPLHGNKTLKVAFEFGLILSEVEKDKGVEL